MSGRQSFLLVIGVILLVVIGYFLLRDAPRSEPEQSTQVVPVQPVPVARETAVPEAPEPEPAIPTEKRPALIGPAASIALSQPLLIDILNNLSPDLVQWMVSEELLRKWVILIDQIADGSLTTKHLPLTYEMAPFAVEGNKDLARVAPANYARAKPLIKAVTRIKPETLVAYYRLWQPLLEEAYAELGKGGTFDDRVLQAIRQLQSVPPMPAQGDIQARPVMYKYIDPKLEKAPALHKWMWRLGPQNQSDIKTYLTQVKLALYRQS
jgi:hypothetical protein